LVHDWSLYRGKAPAQKVLPIKQFLAQKSITETKDPPCSPNLALNNFWAFLNTRYSLKGRFQDIEDIQNCDDGTESYSTTGIPKIFPTVAASLG
jgi:hypothetical protein